MESMGVGEETGPGQLSSMEEPNLNMGVVQKRPNMGVGANMDHQGIQEV